jgi:hypothetical protein
MVNTDALPTISARCPFVTARLTGSVSGSEHGIDAEPLPSAQLIF